MIGLPFFFESIEDRQTTEDTKEHEENLNHKSTRRGAETAESGEKDGACFGLDKNLLERTRFQASWV